jgi:glucokinase
VRVLVYDVGGSHVAGAICRDRGLVARHSIPIDSGGTAHDFYWAIEQLTSAILEEAGVRFDAISGMCFAFPGPFDYKGGISLLEHKFAALHGLSIRHAMAQRLGLEPETIYFLNDADAFLLGELSMMPEVSSGNVMGITLGTGVGSAFAVRGHIVRSGKGVPPGGEIWDYPWRGGVVEDAISTRAIQALYQNKTGQQTSVREIAERCPEDRDAVAVFQEFGRTLGDVLKRVTRDFVPNLIILGGAISRSADLFLPAAETRFPDVPLQVSTLFEEAALFGAAAFWKRKNLTPEE